MGDPARTGAGVVCATNRLQWAKSGERCTSNKLRPHPLRPGYQARFRPQSAQVRKPLKRFPFVEAPHTQLKLGVNERKRGPKNFVVRPLCQKLISLLANRVIPSILIV